MNKLSVSNYNFEHTLLGGQSFSWDFIDEFYYGFTQDKIIKLKLENIKQTHNKKSNETIAKKKSNLPEILNLNNSQTLYWQTYPKNNDIDFINSYFRLNENYLEILNKINKDKYINQAIKQYKFLRILKQPFEQTLISYIISANNSINNIRKSVRLLSNMFGEKIIVDDKTFFLFPTMKKLKQASIEDLQKAKVGFRAKYIQQASNYLYKNNLEQKFKTLNQNEIKTELLKINGIGNKISDCILGYSLGFNNVVPLDVWMKRVLVNFYNFKPNAKYEEMQDFFTNYFNGYSTLAGQFLFEYIRKS